ncbi:MAG: hypothetical protein ACXAC8_19710 [Candidatus Hodarchaeales archaeon]
MRECRNQVTDQGVKSELFFCLTLKEYLDRCPTKCPYLLPGASHSYKGMYELSLDLECMYNQQLILGKASKKVQFLCTLRTKVLICDQCP